MTCIIGLKTKDNVYMGGDSAAVAGLNIEIRRESKVFMNGLYLFGYTSSFRMGHLLQHAFIPPKVCFPEDDHKHMTLTFVDSIRNTFKKYGFASKENETETGGTFLVGYKNNLYHIGDDYQTGIVEEYSAVGCGSQIALGAMHALKDRHPIDRIETSLRAAVKFNAGVRPPFTIISLSGGGVRRIH